jgi:hypothetical protein
MAENGADVYADYVKSLCEDEGVRKSSFESRGLGVITTAGTLISALFALVAVVTGATNFTLPHAGHIYIIAALPLFVASAILGIIVNVPLRYRVGSLTNDELAMKLTDGVVTAEQGVMTTRLAILVSARRGNGFKGRMLVGAIVLLVAGLLMLMVATVYILEGNPHPSKAIPATSTTTAASLPGK